MLFFPSSSYTIKSRSIWQEAELAVYNEVIEMGMDNKEVTVNFSSAYCAIEVPCYIFSFVKFNL